MASKLGNAQHRYSSVGQRRDVVESGPQVTTATLREMTPLARDIISRP